MRFSSAPADLSLRALVVSLFAVSAIAGCGDDGGNDPDPDAGTDTSDNGADTGSDVGDTTTDTNVPPPAESLWAVYTRRATVPGAGVADYTQVFVTNEECRATQSELCSSGTCEATEIMPRTPTEPLCNNGCAVTPAMDWIVFFDPDEGRTLRKAPLGADFQLSADSTIISADVDDLSVGDGVVAYRTGNSLRIHRLDSDDEVELAAPNAPTGFYAAPDGTRVFLNRVTSLQSMSVSSIDTASGAETVVYEFQDGGPRDAAGSLLRGSEPMALSPDGTRLAMLTTFRNQSNSCTSNADCTEPGFQCPTGTSGGRCFQHQHSLQIINLAAADLLDVECTTDSACGADHFCDLSAPDSDGNGRCMPGRILIGPTGQNVCSRISAGQYDLSLPRLGWYTDRTVLALLRNTCLGAGTGIDVTDVVAIDIDAGSLDPIVENPGLAHGGCYDAVEECYDVAECTLEIESMAVSPGGSTVAFVANSYKSDRTTELWFVPARGGRDKEVATGSIQYDIRSVSLHTRE